MQQHRYVFRFPIQYTIGEQPTEWGTECSASRHIRDKRQS